MKTLPSFVLIFATAAAVAFIAGAATVAAGFVSLATLGFAFREYSRPMPVYAELSRSAVTPKMRSLPLAA